MKKIFVWALLAAATARSESLRESGPKGVYALVSSPAFFDPQKDFQFRGDEAVQFLFEVLDRPEMAGFTFYIAWAVMEPERGKIRADIVSTMLEKCAAHGKKMNLGVLIGNTWGPPPWIWSDPKIEKYNPVRAPLGNVTATVTTNVFPLDPIYRAAYREFVASLSEIQTSKSVRLRDHPALGYVAICGPGNGTGLETVLGTTSETAEIERVRKRVAEIMGTPDFETGYQRAWLESISHFSKCFPNKPLGVALQLGLDQRRSTAVAKGLIDGIEKSGMGEQVRLMSLFLTGKDWWDPDFEPRSPGQELLGMLRDSRSRGFLLGLQQIGIASASEKAEDRARPFGKSLEKAASFGAAWIEIWIEDLVRERKYLSENRKFVEPNNPFYREFQEAVSRAAEFFSKK